MGCNLKQNIIPVYMRSDDLLVKNIFNMIPNNIENVACPMIKTVKLPTQNLNREGDALCVLMRNVTLIPCSKPPNRYLQPREWKLLYERLRAKRGWALVTLYRQFPKRSDLVAAVFPREIDICADAASRLASELPPFNALAKWMPHFADFFATKRGLASALHSGDLTFAALPALFDQ